MPIITTQKGEKEGIVQAANLMLLSARTAPKSGGVDDILAITVLGAEKDKLATVMEKIAQERGIEVFRRDAKNVRDSDAVVLIGVVGTRSFGLNCSACGYPNCNAFDKAEKKAGQDFVGPNCAFKILDLGIALGSAVKTASILNVDNRIMYRVGTAAKRLKLLPKASVAIGIPLSARGKSIYFDRRWPPP